MAVGEIDWESVGLSGSIQGPVTSSCEPCNELSNSTKGGEFLGYLIVLLVSQK
jgi:hypothetical protein